jgi:predicted enzyme related to lactoylglutathione lyase
VDITKAYFMLPVHDMDRAVRFYCEVLGLTQKFASPEWTELAWRDATIALHGGGGGEPARWLGFEVADLDAALSEIESAGGRRGQERNEGGVRLVEISDSEGNRLTLGQQSSWAG